MPGDEKEFIQSPDAEMCVCSRCHRADSGSPFQPALQIPYMAEVAPAAERRYHETQRCLSMPRFTSNTLNLGTDKNFVLFLAPGYVQLCSPVC